MNKIVVLGHGYEIGQLTLEAVELLQSGAKIILHTERCGCADWLRQKEIAFESLDTLYETCEDFDEHAQAAADTVLKAAETDDVIYGVFDVRDRSVVLLTKEKNVRVVAGPPVEGALLAQAQGTVQMLEASNWEEYAFSASRSALIRELDNRALASEVKLKLMEVYPEESVVWVQTAGNKVSRVPLVNLDRLKEYDHRTCVLVAAEHDLLKLERYDFDDLRRIVAKLCSFDGCPWDREQTHRSLRPYLVEEAYEVIDAINEDDPFHLYDELGDMLLQVALHADIAHRYGEFEMSDVTTAISEKMIRRHTHIFGSDSVSNADDVSDLWGKNKMAERGEKTVAESMRGVTKSLPAMLRASKVLKRLDSALKTHENVSESLNAVQTLAENFTSVSHLEDALGELLLKSVAVSRACNVDPELALNAATDRIIERFDSIERKICANGHSFEDEPQDALQKYWNLVKLSNFDQ